jgi:hypothetical protein
MANPTTNYGFVLPTSTDLVTDLPADFDVALQGVDTRLKALQPGTTLGDVAYSSATANTNTRLGIGSTGQVLTVAGGVPTWATPAAVGRRIVQIVTGSTNTQTGSASATYADTTLTATITPTLSTSQILVFVSQSGCQKYATNTSMALRLVRGATTILQMATIAGGTGSTADLNWGTMAATYLDSPATTSATTYKTEFNSTNGTTQATVQHGGSTSTIILMEVGA